MSRIVALSARGAGMSGLVYPAAIEELYASSAVGYFDPKILHGTSSGGLAMALLANGGTGAMREALASAEFASFSRDLNPRMPGFAESALDALRLLRSGGLNSGARLGKWLDDLFGGLTFGDLRAQKGIDLCVWAYDIRAAQAVPFDWRCRPPSGTGHDQVRVALAVRASMAIPGYFAPVEIKGRQYWDGGLTINDALIGLRASRNDLAPDQVVGLRVRPRDGSARRGEDGSINIRAALTYLGKALTDSSENTARLLLGEEWRRRSIEIDRCGVGATDFEIGKDKIAELERSGRQAARRWIAENYPEKEDK